MRCRAFNLNYSLNFFSAFEFKNFVTGVYLKLKFPGNQTGVTWKLSCMKHHLVCIKRSSSKPSQLNRNYSVLTRQISLSDVVL